MGEPRFKFAAPPSDYQTGRLGHFRPACLVDFRRTRVARLTKLSRLMSCECANKKQWIQLDASGNPIFLSSSRKRPNCELQLAIMTIRFKSMIQIIIIIIWPPSPLLQALPASSLAAERAAGGLQGICSRPRSAIIIKTNLCPLGKPVKEYSPAKISGHFFRSVCSPTDQVAPNQVIFK